MQTVYPRGQVNWAPSSLWGGAMAVEKGVLHTTESRGRFSPGAAYFGGTSWPHFTVARGIVWQHIPINRSARALLHPSGTPATNSDGAVQIEIDWNAADAHNLPADTTAAVRDLVAWICEQTGIPPVWTARGVHDYPPEGGIRLGREPWRMTWPEWDAFRGWCGHCHVPANDHGDPGRLDLAALGLTDPLNPTPEDDDMPITQADARLVAQEVLYLLSGDAHADGQPGADRTNLGTVMAQIAPRGGGPIRDVCEAGLNASNLAAMKGSGGNVDTAAIIAAIKAGPADTVAAIKAAL
jgi:hypothetical protein